MIKYMPHKTTITGQVYADTLKEIRENIKEKRSEKLSKGIIILHDNAPVHKTNVVKKSLVECGFEELQHPAYSPD